MTSSFTPYDVTDITGPAVAFQPAATTVAGYFGRLIDALFNRPSESEPQPITFTKTEIRQMYMRAYPKAKV